VHSAFGDRREGEVFTSWTLSTGALRRRTAVISRRVRERGRILKLESTAPAQSASVEDRMELSTLERATVPVGPARASPRASCRIHAPRLELPLESLPGGARGMAGCAKLWRGASGVFLYG
jgi:hypothetical protein